MNPTKKGVLTLNLILTGFVLGILNLLFGMLSKPDPISFIILSTIIGGAIGYGLEKGKGLKIEDILRKYQLWGFIIPWFVFIVFAKRGTDMGAYKGMEGLYLFPIFVITLFISIILVIIGHKLEKKNNH